MRLRAAKEQVEREHPELTGSAKLEAIKALRARPEATGTERKTATARDAARCAHCDQQVKPVERRGWAGFLGWLALLEFASVIVAIVAAFTTVDPDSVGGGIGRLVMWPAAVHPVWLSVIAALAAFLTLAGGAGSASRRATAAATCPKCGLRLAEPSPAA